MTVIKRELARNVAEETGLTNRDALKVIDALCRSIKTRLSEGEKVQILGFGAFEVRNRAERKGRDPRNGQTVRIPPTKVPVMKAGKFLKEAVNK